MVVRNELRKEQTPTLSLARDEDGSNLTVWLTSVGVSQRGRGRHDLAWRGGEREGMGGSRENESSKRSIFLIFGRSVLDDDVQGVF